MFPKFIVFTFPFLNRLFPLDFVEAGRCSENHAIHKILTQCEPRPYIHFLGKSFIPMALSIKRCDGICSEHNSCLPTKKENITFLVTKFQGENGTTSAICTPITIEQHHKCICVESVNCFKHNDVKRCLGYCKNKYEFESCIHSDRYWDEEECACLYMEKPCTSFSRWDKESGICIPE